MQERNRMMLICTVVLTTKPRDAGMRSSVENETAWCWYAWW